MRRVRPRACPPQELNVKDLKITSPAFDHHKQIPERHTSNGEDVAPALEWTGVPEGTKAFAIVVHDPDAPLVDGFTHWVAYGIPGDATGLPEGAATPWRRELVGRTGNTTVRHPLPITGRTTTTSGSTRWTTELDLEPGLDRRALLERIEDHVIEQARLVGTYANKG